MIWKHKEKILEWFVVVLLLGGVAYAATTAWKNEARLATVGEDVKSIKRSIISLLLEDEPDKASIARDLVRSTEFLEGVESFKQGNYEKAYTTWESAATAGDRDAVYAIAVANDTLRLKAANPDISESEREEIIRALEIAPEVEEESGLYTFPRSKRDD
jgi:hypothetical protein